MFAADALCQLAHLLWLPRNTRPGDLRVHIRHLQAIRGERQEGEIALTALENMSSEVKIRERSEF